MGHIEKSYVFLGGTGRSGTNVTKSIFTAHPQVITLPFEHRFVIDPDGVIDCYQGLLTSWSPFASDKKIDRLGKFLAKLSRRNWIKFKIGRLVNYFDPSGKTITPPEYYGWELSKWFPNYDHHVNELISRLQEYRYYGVWPGARGGVVKNQIAFVGNHQQHELAEIFGSFLRGCYGDILGHSGKSVFVEDNTWNLLFANSISSLMPEAKFIEIIRDPRDVVASLVNQRWSPSDLEQATAFYKSIVFRQQECLSQLDDDKVLRIRMEDLIHEPEKKIREMCSFVNIEVNSAMMDIDLSRGNMGRWKLQFNSQEQGFLSSSLRKIIKNEGYKTGG